MCWFESSRRRYKFNIYYAVCPGGEGAVLKTVGLYGLAGSNPVCGVKKSGIIDKGSRTCFK